MHPSNLPPYTLSSREFTICRDRHGNWLAIEAHGLLGGVFVSCEAAERFALHEADGDRRRVHFASRPDRAP